jgi:hypothetical protein
MSSHLAYQASLARVEDLRGEARRAERLAEGPRVRLGLGVLSRWAHRTA